MDVHLIDGTYELFRVFFAVPPTSDLNGQEIGAVRGVLHSVLSMIERGATHLGVATDHLVESFRNDLYPGYKTSEGVAPELLSQYADLEDIPKSFRDWHPSIRGAERLATSLFASWSDALCFAHWQPCDWMYPSLTRWMSFIGKARARALRNSAAG